MKTTLERWETVLKELEFSLGTIKDERTKSEIRSQIEIAKSQISKFKSEVK